MKENILNTVPFFGVSDMEKSIQFYVDGLGFEITHRWIPQQKIEWCALKREGGNLMLQEFHAKGHDSWVPEGKPGIGISIVFICSDALSLYHEFLDKGLNVSEPFVGNNMWVISVKDPDGYDLFFESDTDVPEETLYSDWNKKQ